MDELDEVFRAQINVFEALDLFEVVAQEQIVSFTTLGGLLS